VAKGLQPTTVIANNLVVSTKVATNAFYCVNGPIPQPTNFYNNDVVSARGSAYGGMCGTPTGSNGNISKRPVFVSQSDFSLKGGSAGIDAGSNKAPDLSSKDLAGNRRIINGNDGSAAIIDIGAYEFVPVTLTPASLNFGSQAVGTSTSKTVKLTNEQHRVLDISSFASPTGYSVAGCPATLAAFASCELTVTFSPRATGTFRGPLKVLDNAGNNPQTVTVSGTAH
jgi:hypothetical protein